MPGDFQYFQEQLQIPGAFQEFSAVTLLVGGRKGIRPVKI